MFERQHLERILSVHGLSPEVSDEEIKSFLLQQDWHMDDIDAAIMVLRENPNQHRSHTHALYQVQRTDERLRPETIKAMLGIDIDITSMDILKRRRDKQTISPRQIMSIVLTSVVLGALLVLVSMWFMDAGVFHIAAAT